MYFVYYRECDKIIYVTTPSYYLDKEQQLSDVKEDLGQVKRHLELLRRERQEIKHRLAKERDGIFTDLQELRKKFYKMFDELEKKAKTELLEIYEDFAVKTKDEMQTCSDIIASVEAVLPRLSTQMRTEREAFSHVKDARASVINGWYAINSIKRASGERRISFTLDKSVEKLLSDVQRLGYFGSLSDVYTVNFESEYNASIEEDVIRKDLVYFGSAFLKNGSLLLTDFKNKKLKRIEPTFDSLSALDVPGHPFAVCPINKITGAISLPNEQRIQLVSLENPMKLCSSFETEAKCRGLCHYDGELYASSGGGFSESPAHIRVFSLEGELLQLIDPESRGERYLSSPVNLAISVDGETIYIADRNKGIIILNREGSVLDTVCKNSLKTPQDITLGDSGGLIACDHASSSVIYINKDGNKFGVVLKEDENVKNPLSVSYDICTKRLVVTCRNSNKFKIFSLRPIQI